MDNIQKLIASTEINHGGVKATEQRLEVMARVIEVLVERLKTIELLLPTGLVLDAEIKTGDKDTILTCLDGIDDEIQQAFQQANEIAGEI